MTSIPRSVEVRMEGLSLEGILNLPERSGQEGGASKRSGPSRAAGLQEADHAHAAS